MPLLWTDKCTESKECENQHKDTLCKIASKLLLPTKTQKILSDKGYTYTLFIWNSQQRKSWAVTLLPQDPSDTKSLAAIHRQLDVSLLSDTHSDKWVKIHSNGQR